MTRKFNTLKKSLKILLCLIFVTATMGCSVTSLQCGVDGDSSFVNLNTTPKVLSQNVRNMAQICAFAYDIDKDG